MKDGLKDKHRRSIIEILSANERVERVVLFGSRAMQTHTPASDVDLALFGEGLTLIDQTRMAAAIERLPMPQQVDLLVYSHIDNKNLKKHIRTYGVEWINKKKQKRFLED